MLADSIPALTRSRAIEVGPGLVAAWVVLTVGFVWPVWPTCRVYTLRRRGLIVHVAAMMTVLAASVGLGVVWSEPVLARVPPLPATFWAAAVMAGCWWRAWRLRDPLQRPVDPTSR